MSVDICTRITDYDWNETTRPELRLSVSAQTHSANLQIGRDAIAGYVLELSGGYEDLLSQLEGYAEIFGAAVAHMRSLQPNAQANRRLCREEKHDE